MSEMPGQAPIFEQKTVLDAAEESESNWTNE